MAKYIDRPIKPYHNYTETTFFFYEGYPYAMFDAADECFHMALPYKFLTRNGYGKFSLSYKGFMRVLCESNEVARVLCEQWANVMFGKPMSAEDAEHARGYWENIMKTQTTEVDYSNPSVALVDKSYKKVVQVSDGVITDKEEIQNIEVDIRNGVSLEEYLKYYGVGEYTQLRIKPFYLRLHSANGAYQPYTYLYKYCRKSDQGVCFGHHTSCATPGAQFGHIAEVTVYDKDGKFLSTKVYHCMHVGYPRCPNILIAHTHEDFKPYMRPSRYGSNTGVLTNGVVDCLLGKGHYDGGPTELYESTEERLEGEAIELVANLKFRMANPNKEYAVSPLKRILFDKEDPEKVIKEAVEWLHRTEARAEEFRATDFPEEYFVEWGCPEYAGVHRRSLWPKTAITVPMWEVQQNEREVR